MKYLNFLIIVLLAFFATQMQAKVVLTGLFSDNMVFQQNSSAAIWGQASGKKVTVEADWLDAAIEVPVQNGKWKAFLPTPAASYGAHTVIIKDNESERRIENILIGEVWICSGQSNMEMTLKGFNQQEVEGALEQAIKAGTFRNRVRAVTVDRHESEAPRETFKGKWTVPDPESVLGISATAWYFATTLTVMRDVPVGIVCTSRGSSKIEAWIPKEILREDFGYDVEKINSDPEIRGVAKCGLLYNGMLAPVSGYTAKGFLWYQGESNRNNPEIYPQLMSSMVSQWRKLWGDERAEMPFIYVQIAPYSYDDPDGISLPKMVEAQLSALDLIENSAIVATTDLGNRYRIHPPTKEAVGQRAAVEACRKAYSINIPDASGMRVSEVQFEDGKVSVSFTNAVRGLPENTEIKGFELAGEDGVFYEAEAKICKGKPTVELSSENVKNPVEVRYAYRNYMETNLKNTLGYPAYPFRKTK